MPVQPPSCPPARPARRWLLRGLLGLVAASLAGKLPRPLVTLGPQMSVSSCNPKLGVHTRLTDEVEEWKIKHTLVMVREMGARWVVEYFPWAYCEPEPGQFSWSHADMVLAHAARQGLTVIARLGYPPAWARPKDSPPSFLDAESYPAFARFCSQFVRRYHEQIHHIIVWNEPNLAMEWGFRRPAAEQYTALLQACYPAIKAESSAITVLAGALAPMPSPLNDVLAQDDLTYLRAMYDAGAAACFDGLAIHAYGWAYPPEDGPAADRVNFRRAELIRQVMVANGDGQKPGFVTEAGWNDHPRWTRAVSALLRLQYTLQAYDYAWKQWHWCQAVAMWAFRFPWPQRSYQDYFAFVTPQFEPRPIYDAIRGYAATCSLAANVAPRL